MNIEESCHTFFELLEKPRIKIFLKNDKCKVLADKYILASVLIYFRRAKFNKDDYNRRNFYLALYLTHEIQEDVDDFKDDIVDDYFGSYKARIKRYHEKFLKDRFALFQKLEYDGNVTKEMCDYFIMKTPHWAWKRTRDTKHSGVFYKHIQCKNCYVSK